MSVSGEIIIGNATVKYVCKPTFNPINQAVTPVFTLIFILSVIGNSLVIVTIVQNRRMRTPTNMFLLNLAISDLFLSVLCMPTTLTAFIFQCFFYGHVMCTLITYLQPVSVAASAHTLVVIAVERYYAICKPLQSRMWQTKRHCFRMIGAVWVISVLLNLPYAIYGKIMPAGPGKTPNCSPNFPLEPYFRQYYWLFLVIVLLIIPSLIMTLLYIAVMCTLYRGIMDDVAATSVRRTSTEDTIVVDEHRASVSTMSSARRVNLRSTHSHRNLLAKRKVIRMLAVIVVEFNICWTPLFVYHLLRHFEQVNHSRRVNAIVHSTFLSLAYMSACTNPLTYCFLNKKFRNAFLFAFGCRTKTETRTPASMHQSTFQNRAVQLARRSIDRRLLDDFAEGNGTTVNIANGTKRNGVQFQMEKLQEEE